MKIFSIIILCAVLLSMMGCQNPSYSKMPDQTESVVRDWDVSGYTDIISDYQALVAYRLSDTFEAKWNDGEYISESQSLINSKADTDGDRDSHGVNLESKWSYMIVDMLAGLENPSAGDFGYFLEDINGDSVSELFWVRNDKTVLAIFTICDGNAVLLDAFYSRYPCVVTSRWQIYTIGSAGVCNQYDIKSLSAEGNLEVVRSFGTERDAKGVGVQYFEIQMGQKHLVNEIEFQELLAWNPFEFGPKWSDLQISWLE